MELEVLRARPSTKFSIKFLNEQIDLLRGKKKRKRKRKKRDEFSGKVGSVPMIFWLACC
jgi:hypothetical protein